MSLEAIMKLINGLLIIIQKAWEGNFGSMEFTVGEKFKVTLSTEEFKKE